MSYGPSCGPYRRVATYVDKVLKGPNRRPPVEQPTKLSGHQPGRWSLGLTDSTLFLADEVIR
jgi:hypothetical protein